MYKKEILDQNRNGMFSLHSFCIFIIPLIKLKLSKSMFLIFVILLLQIINVSCKTCKCPAYSQNMIKHIEIPEFSTI